jgi:hypothetical protein
MKVKVGRNESVERNTMNKNLLFDALTKENMPA